MGLSQGTALIMLSRWVGTLVLLFALIALVSVFVDRARDWLTSRALGR